MKIEIKTRIAKQAADLTNGRRIQLWCLMVKK